MLTYPHPTPPAPGEAITVAPGVHWLRMPLPFKLDHINLWALEDGDGWTLVDSGYGNTATCELWEQHFTTTLQGRPVKRIIVTHYHPDHVGCAGWLHQRTGAPLWMTAAEYFSAHAAVDDFAGFDRDNTAQLFIKHGVAKLRPHFGEAQQARSNAFKRGVPTVPKQYQRIMDGDLIRIGSRDWRIISVYGHAPEHATLYTADGGILISGDQILPRITTNVGVWGNQPEANPLKLFLNSLHRFDDLPADTLVLPSHDRVFSGLHTRLTQLHEHHAARLSELLAALTSPLTAAEALPVLFKRELDDHQLVFAIGETIAHLHYLWAAGDVVRTVDLEGLYRFQAVQTA